MPGYPSKGMSLNFFLNPRFEFPDETTEAKVASYAILKEDAARNVMGASEVKKIQDSLAMGGE